MADFIVGIFVLLLLLMVIIQEWFTFQCMNRSIARNRVKNSVLLLCGTFNIAWTICAAIKGMSVLALFTGLFLSFFISLIPLYDENFIWIRFCQMKFIVLTSTILIFLGIACLFGTDVQQVSHIREVRLFVLLGAKASEITYILLYKRFFMKDFEREERDKKKIGVFQGFLLSCLVYIYVDGILAIYDFGEDFVPALMISGNILILVLMFMFYRFDYIMEQKEDLEKERQRLEEQKARELWKAEALKSMAEKDALTGAYSRRYAIEKTDGFQAEGVPFLIIYIDMDSMKEINDKRGHQAGDIYLKNFVENISKKLRRDDFIARLGGDEFLVVLYRCSTEDGKRRMEEISMSLPEYSFSYGIASDGKSVEAMIEEADSSMYSLKKQKRGRSIR